MSDNHANALPSKDDIDALERLAALHKAGDLSDDEFVEEKNVLLHHTQPEVPIAQVSRKNSSRKWILIAAAVVVSLFGLLVYFFAFHRMAPREERRADLLKACGFGDTAAIGQLLRQDSTLSAGSPNCIAVAMRARKREAVKLLIAFRVNPNGVDDSGYTPLMYAAAMGDTACVRVIYRGGAIVDAVSSHPKEEGTTAVMQAAMYGRPETINTLAELGANLSLTDNSGKTALDYASARGKAQASKVLLQHGASSTLPSIATVYLKGRFFGTSSRMLIYSDIPNDRYAVDLAMRNPYSNENIAVRTITTGEDTYTVNYNQHTVAHRLRDRSQADVGKMIDLESIVGSIGDYSLLDSHMDTVLFLGKPCQALTIGTYGYRIKCWLWNSMPLKIGVWSESGQIVDLSATKIDDKSGIDEAKFRIPLGFARGD